MGMEASERPFLKVNIYSPAGLVYSHRAYACNVMTLEGGLTFLPRHLPVLAALKISAVKVTRIEEGEPVDYIAINGGMVSMSDNTIEIISNYAVRARDIDEAKVEIERQKAIEAMEAAKQAHDRRAFKRAQLSLERAINQISVSKHRRIK